MRHGWVGIVLGLLSGMVACLFDAREVEGLECSNSEDCGPYFDCVNGRCGGEPTDDDDDSDDSVNPTTTATNNTTSESSDDDESSGGDPSVEELCSMGIGVGECPCMTSYIGDNECDEAQGTGICPAGSDTADCTCATENNGTCDAGITCPARSDPADCCTDPGNLCSFDTECCGTALCVGLSDTESRCGDRCTLGSGCSGCCCLETVGGDLVCVPSDLCEGSAEECIPGTCGLGGSPCVVDTDCCNGICDQVRDEDRRICFTNCVTNEECSSGCCADGSCQSPDACL